MNRNVTIVDYGMGNLLSVAKAFEHCGAHIRISDQYRHVVDAEFLVLPGVGAFANAMKVLQEKNLDTAVKEFSLKERPFLGICLGMQMMLEWSEEFGLHQGLGLLPGKVKAIEATDIDGNPHKIPHMGWTEIVPSASGANWKTTILRETEPGTAFYFVHSFTAVPDSPENRLAEAHYNGRLLSAAISSGPMYGCQFHPEKSGKEGLKLIESFLLT